MPEFLSAAAGVLAALPFTTLICWFVVTGLIERYAKPAAAQAAGYVGDKLLSALPDALRMMDNLLPSILDEGRTGEDVEAAMRELLSNATGQEWAAATPEEQQEAVDRAFEVWDLRAAMEHLEERRGS